MNLEKTLGGAYLKAADFDDQPAVFTITGCDWQPVGQGEAAKYKAVMSFQGQEKKLVLNATNKKVLIKAFGKHTPAYTGKQIEVYPTVCDYQGEQVDCLRMRVPEPASPSAVATEVTSTPASEDIPF